MPKPVTSNENKPTPARTAKRAPVKRAAPREKATNGTQKEMAARCLAIGFTQQRTSVEAQVTLRTVQNWCTDATFMARVDELRQDAFQRIEPKVWANLELALENERQVLAGEMQADDARYVESRKLLDRLVAKLFYVAEASTPGGNAAAAASLNVYVGGEQSDRPPGRRVSEPIDG